MDIDRILCDQHDDVRQLHIDELREAVAMLAHHPFHAHFVRCCQREIERRAAR